MPAVSRPQLVAYALAALSWWPLGVRFMQGQARGSAAAVPAAAAPSSGSGTVRLEPREGRRSRSSTWPGRCAARASTGCATASASRTPCGARAARARARTSTRINLAAKVADGQQVVVPRRGAAGAAPVDAGAGSGAAGGPPQAPVSLNTATAEQLDTLDGVGPATASKILEYRRQHGGFRSIDDLGEIPGIGPKRLAALRGKVQL